MKLSYQPRNKNGVRPRKEKMRCLSRKVNRKAERRKKKEKKNQKYLQRFSKIDPEVLEETVQKGDTTQTTDMKKGQKDIAAPKKKGKTASKSEAKNTLSAKNRDIKPIREVEKEVAVKKRPYEDAAMARDQQQLRQLEKQLKLKKRSSLPKSFIDDGLDFLLDVVDSKKLYAMKERGEELPFPEPVKKAEKKKVTKDSSTVEPRSPSKKQTKTGKTVRFQLDEDDSDQDLDGNMENHDFQNNSDNESGEVMDTDSDESEEDDDEGSMDEGDAMEDDGEDGDESDEADDAEDGDDMMGTDDEDEDGDAGKVKEDIYGRLVDSQGNLVSNKEQGGTYIPPAKRAALLAASGQESVELDRLKKQMKGLLNRASESNMQGIANSVEALYMQHSRASVNQSLFTLILEAVVSPVLAPERLVAEMVMLVAILHGNVGSEVGAYFLQHIVKRYEELRQEEQYGDQHTMDNIVLLLCYIYNFKVVHHTLLFEVISQLVEFFSEKDIELLLLIIKSAGFYLRRDDPEALGNQISSIQQKARGLEESGTAVPVRVRFMLEVLVAVRNNNVRRVPGADVGRTDRMRQLAGKFVRGGSLADNKLKIGLKDLLQADDKGRWWIVGSAWEGRLEPESDSKGAAKSSGAPSVVGAVSQKLVQLGKKLRINSDLRRSIFYVLMSSEDYEDAFQKVLGLGLKGPQQQEIVVVAVLCCKQEATYNPFYSFFLQKLAAHERKFMIAIQFHMWDMFKTMEDLNSCSRNNLAAMLAHLLATKSLSLSVLKVLEFGVLDKVMVKFLRKVFTTLLTTASMIELKDIFRSVAQLHKFRTLADGLRMFLVKHMKLEGEEKQKLVEVCNELSQNHQLLM
ncbi:hypothetical protein ACOMHN_005975 [Nucella lapillus]